MWSYTLNLYAVLSCYLFKKEKHLSALFSPVKCPVTHSASSWVPPRIAFFLLMLIVQFLNAKAQIPPGTYSSGYYIEMRWNAYRKEYEKMQTVELSSGFRMDNQGIAFKKGSSQKWLYNQWQYKGELAHKRNVASDWYMDERGQKIVLDYDNEMLLYYHEYDKAQKQYQRLTIYKNLKVLETAEESSNEDADKFRVDTDYFAIYDGKKDSWSEWKEGFNSFVINYNDNGDILHIMGSGKQVIYRKISKGVERKKTDSGKGYQLVEVIDEDGATCSFQIFDDYTIGIKLIYSNMIIQFSKR